MGVQRGWGTEKMGQRGWGRDVGVRKEWGQSTNVSLEQMPPGKDKDPEDGSGPGWTTLPPSGVSPSFPKEPSSPGSKACAGWLVICRKQQFWDVWKPQEAGEKAGHLPLAKVQQAGGVFIIC